MKIFFFKDELFYLNSNNKIINNNKNLIILLDILNLSFNILSDLINVDEKSKLLNIFKEIYSQIVLTFKFSSNEGLQDKLLKLNHKNKK